MKNEITALFDKAAADITEKEQQLIKEVVGQIDQGGLIRGRLKSNPQGVVG
jgi:hypothetical protein